jgi:Mn2+/Fe2+ NRAMP family transporter
VWKRTLVTRAIAIVPAITCAFIYNFDSVVTILNIVQSIQLPFALIPLLKFTSSEMIMGPFATSKSGIIIAVVLGSFLVALNIGGLFPRDGKVVCV